MRQNNGDYKPMPVENAEALLAQPNSEDYWDMRRDLLRQVS